MKFKIFESKEKSSVTLILLTISKHQKHNSLLKTPKNMRDLKKTQKYCWYDEEKYCCSITYTLLLYWTTTKIVIAFVAAVLILRWHNGLITFQDFQSPLEMHWKLGKANATRIDYKKKIKTHRADVVVLLLYLHT